MNLESLNKVNRLLGSIKSIELYDLEKEAEKENDSELKQACYEAYMKINMVNILLFTRMEKLKLENEKKDSL